MSRYLKYSGFTMIELLVAISIIGIVLALSFFGIQNSRAVSRDARRKSDLESIRSSLELYYADCKEYPTSVASGDPITGDATCGSNEYMDTVPDDPITDNVYYYKRIDTNNYVLCSTLEADTGTPDGECGSCGTSACQYSVNNP
ncbi:type II secretion system protein [Patescibacteria group bacterium]